MMRCRIKLVRLTEEFLAFHSRRTSHNADDSIPFPVSSIKAQPVSPTESLGSFDFNHPQSKITNTKKESKARPLSKIKGAKTPSLNHQTMNKNSTSTSPMKTLDQLAKCQGCRVLVIDCLHGRQLPPYAKKLLNQYKSMQDKDFIVSDKPEKKVKKKKKKDKGMEIKVMMSTVVLFSFSI